MAEVCSDCTSPEAAASRIASGITCEGPRGITTTNIVDEGNNMKFVEAPDTPICPVVKPNLARFAHPVESTSTASEEN